MRVTGNVVDRDTQGKVRGVSPPCARSAVLATWTALDGCDGRAQAAKKLHRYNKNVGGDFSGGAYIHDIKREVVHWQNSQDQHGLATAAFANWNLLASLVPVLVFAVCVAWFIKRKWDRWFPPPSTSRHPQQPPPEPWLLIEDDGRVLPSVKQQRARRPREVAAHRRAPTITSLHTISRNLRATRFASSRKIIAEGAFGRVEKGRLLDAAGAAHDVAVKFAKSCEDRDMLLQTFTAEIQCFEGIPPHPNVIRCFGGRLGDPASVDDIFIVEELMDMNLHDFTTVQRMAWKPWTYRMVLRIFREIAQGLDHLHGHKISHYDLKPENVLVKFVDGDIKVKLADFGCSQIKQRTYATAKYAGTKHYMAPEILLASVCTLRASGKIDVYSLGVIMWEILTGGAARDVCPPSIEAYMKWPCKDKCPIMDHHPAELSTLIWSCLEFDSFKRPAARMVMERVHCMLASAWIDEEVVQERALH